MLNVSQEKGKSSLRQRILMGANDRSSERKKSDPGERMLPESVQSKQHEEMDNKFWITLKFCKLVMRHDFINDRSLSDEIRQ